MKKSPSSSLVQSLSGLFLFAVLIFTAFAPAANAGTYWWNGSTTSTTTNYAWGSTLNWDNAASGGASGAAPTSASDTAIFNKDSLSAGNFTLANNSWIGLNGARAVGGLQFTNGTGGWTIAAHTTSTTSEQLSIDAGGVTVGAGVGSVGIQSVSGRGTITVALTANQTWNVNSPMTCAAVISGAYNLTKSGTTNLTLSFANTYSGTTTVSAGTLFLSNVNAIQNSTSVSVSSGATLQLAATGGGTYAAPNISLVGTGATSSYGALSITTGSTTLNAPLSLGGATQIGSFGVGIIATLGGAITGTGPLTISAQGGSGYAQTAVWTLNAASSYSGDTTIQNNKGLKDMTVKLGVANALPTTGNLNLLPISNTALSSPATNQFVTLDLNGFNQTVAGLTDTNGSVSSTSSAAKRVINSSGTLATLTINNSGADTYGTTGTKVLAGTLGGTTSDGVTAANNLALVKTGAGALTLSATNTYTGSTTVSNGLINLGVAEMAGTGGPLGKPTTLANSIILQGGGLQFSANNAYDYTTSGRLQLADGATGIIDDGGQTVTFANAIGVGASSTGALTKQGAGTLNLSVANTYTGDTTISAGTLTLGASGSIASANIIANGTYNVSSVTGGYHLTTGKTLSGTGTVTGPVTVDSGATNTVAGTTGTTMGTLTVNGGLTLNGTMTLRLNKGGGTTSDKLTWSSGTVTLGGTLNLSSVGTTLANGDSFTILKNGATGAFTSITPSTPGTGLAWDTSALNSSGVIGVTLAITGTISATPANFSAALNAVVGTASSPTSVTISSSGTISGSITATAPTGLEVSSDNITYGNTATFSPSGGTLYARLSASAAAGTYNSLNVVLSGTGAVSVNVATTASGNQVAAGPFWAVASSGNWGTAGDWFAGTIASGSGVTADFSQVDITSDTTVHLDSSYTVGNLIFGNTNASPAANWILDNNGSSGNTLTLAGGTPTVTVNNLGTGKSATISAEIDGTNFIKAGTGTLTLAPGTATDTMGSLKAAAGGLTLTGGTLNVTNIGTAAGNGFWINGGTVTVAGGTLNANAGLVTIQGGGTLAVSSGTFNAGSGTSLLDGYNTSSGTVTVSGTGLLIANFLRVSQLTGLGTVNLNGGTLQLNSFTDTGSGGTVNFNGTTVQARSATTAFTATNANLTYKVQAGGAIFDTAGYNLTIGSPLVSGSSPDGGLTKKGLGTLTLTNANTYTGGTTNSAGTLALSGGGTLGATTGALTLSGGTLDLGALTTPQVGAVSLTGASIITNGTLTASSYSATLTSGTAAIYAILAGSGTALTMNGAGGTLALNNANTYTGNTTINAGALVGVVGGGCASSAVTVSPASGTGALGVSITDNTKQWSCASLTTSGAGTPVLDFNFGATLPSGSTAPLAVTGAATFTTTPTVTVDVSGGITVGTYPLVTMASHSGIAPTVVSIPGVMGNYHLTLTGSGPYTLNLVVDSIATSPFKWAASGSGTWDTTSLNWKDSSTPTPGTYAYSDGLAVVFDDTYLSADTTVTLNTTVNPASLTANNSTYNYTITGSGAIAGSTGLTKSGTDTLTLATANTYAGGTTVSAGTLALSGGGTLGTNTGALTLSGGTLDLGGNSQTSGAVSITAAASGNTIQNGSLTGSSYVANVASGNAIVSAALLVNGSVGFTNKGAGTVTLAGANTYAGTTFVTNGTLNLTGNRTAAAGAITIQRNATLGIGGGTFSLGANSLGVNSIAGTTSTVNQTNGSISFTGGNELLLGSGASSSGIYNLSGGTVTTVGFNSLTNRGVILGVGSSCSGTFNLSGTGTLNMSATDSTMEIGRSDLDTQSANAANTTGIFNQTGGSATVYRLGMGGAFGTQTNTTSQLNLSGGTFSASVFSYLSFGNYSTSSISISGTADVTLPPFPNALGGGATATITFNGGILRPAAASAGYLGGVTSVDIMTGGAVLGVVSGNDITITQNLLADGVSTGGGLTKTGTGVLTLSGANTYTGNTTNSAGTLLINGSIGSGAVTNYSGATLGGTGTIGGNVSFASGALALFTNGATLTISGSLIANNNTVDLNLSNNVPAGIYTLATYNTSGSSGAFNAVPTIVNGGSFAANTTNFITTTGGSVNLNVQNTYNLVASSGPHGTVTPSGTTVVNSGGSQTYTITPNSGYVVSDVQVDGGSVGAITAYTFGSVAANHTISASFVLACTTPNATVTAASSVCAGSTGNTASAPTGADTYAWSISGGTITAGANTHVITYTAGGAGTLTLTCAATNGGSCYDVKSATVTVNALPTTGSITGTNLVTHGTTNTYSVTATAGSTYGWSVPVNATYTGGIGSGISVIFSTNSGVITVIETNASGCTGTQQSLAVTVAANNAPTANVMNVLRTPGEMVLIALTDLATNWSDTDGDLVRMTAFNGVTSNGMNLTPLYLTTTNDWSVTSYLTAAGGFLGYTNTANVNDQFTYSVGDGYGGTNIGCVNIVVSPFVAGTQTITGQQTTNSITGGSFTVTYYGIPGYTYLLERSTNLTIWADIATNTIGSGGVTNVIDNFSDVPGGHPSAAYYRVGWKTSY